MKWFRNQPSQKWIVGFGACLLAGSTLSAVAALKVPGLRQWSYSLLGGKSLHSWLQNSEGGSAVESALYRLMHLPFGDVLYPRSPRETRPALAEMIKKSAKDGALYSLKALQDEQALDFRSAEADWKAWVEHSPDRESAELDLADFYKRRLRPQDEVATLLAVGKAPAPAEEKFTQADEQRSWKAFQRTLSVIDDQALGQEVAIQTYRAWIARYPAELAPYSKFFDFLIARQQYQPAEQLIAQYSQAFPQDKIFPVKAKATLAYRRESVTAGLAVYENAFQPLWPAQLVDSYMSLLKETHSYPVFLDRVRGELNRNPDNLDAAARLFYAYQRDGHLDAAKLVLKDFRKNKEGRGIPWKAEELYTLAQLLQDVQDNTEAARYYFALYNSQGMSDAQEKALAGIVQILFSAPEQPLHFGSGNLSMYRDIATMDDGPGYLNGILSLLLNRTAPAYQYSEENRMAGSYFHRGKAAALLAQFDSRFPNAPERPELHALMISAFGVYGDDDAVIREGKDFLEHFPKDPQRVSVALTVADSYARKKQTTEEFALYARMLQELSAAAEGVPLGNRTSAYSRPAELAGKNSSSVDNGAVSTPGQALSVESESGKPNETQVRSPQYKKILDRYLARLVSMQQLPQALTVLRTELDHNPNDPGIYEKLAEFLEQNQLGSHEEEVYRKAIDQFDDKGWYSKLARFYLREKRRSEYETLTKKVSDIFSGTELEEYFSAAPAPGSHLSLAVNLYAHKRFPHDLVFVNNLLSLYRQKETKDLAAWEKLLGEHWFESEMLRNQFFAYLAQNDKLEESIHQLQQQNNELEHQDWAGLAKNNPAAADFFVQAQLWRSHFEESAPVAEALSQEYPGDERFGTQASALFRSLAYFDPKATDRSVAIEKRLLDYAPGDMDRLALIGDIYADRNRYDDAAPYWFRMAEIHPGRNDGYLESATVFWDYFDYQHALSQMEKGRQSLHNPTLYSYEVGAIYEGRGERAKAIAEYLRGALASDGDTQCRSRLLTLSRRTGFAAEIENATAGLLKKDNPSLAEIGLRVDLLKAKNDKPGLVASLKGVLDRSTSLEVIEYVKATAQEQSLVQVQQHALEKQIAVVADPIRRLQLDYELVSFYENNNQPAAAQSLVDKLYAENPKLLGVVRSTVDFDWEHNRKQQAVKVLEEAATRAYPEMAQRLRFEEARKLTDLEQYPPARDVLKELLQSAPFDSGYLAAMSDTYGRAGDDAGLRDFSLQKIQEVKSSSLDRGQKTAIIAGLRRGMIPALTRLKDPSEAVEQYIQLLNSYPEDEGLMNEAALYSARYQQQEKILGFYRKTVTEAPKDSRWPIVLAKMEQTLEDYPAAIEAYGQAIKIRPDRVDLYTERANLEERLLRYDAAIADYEKLYGLTYKDSSWMEKIAETRARQGKPDLVVQALTTAFLGGKSVTAEDYFQVARKLETWGFLPEAATFAEKGVASAGDDLLADPRNHDGAKLYVEILSRLRKTDLAFARLEQGLAAAKKEPVLSLLIQQAQAEGIAAVTDAEWRKQKQQQRIASGRGGFANGLGAMASVVRDYYTPEEKQEFAKLLVSKQSAAGLDDLSQFYLPAAHTAVLTDLEADLHWKLVQNTAQNRPWSQWVETQRSRLRYLEIGKQLESLAPSLAVNERVPVFSAAAAAYRDAGDTVSELRVLSHLGRNEQQERYLELLLAQQPRRFVTLAGSGNKKTRDAIAQFAIYHAAPSLAMEVVKARGTGLDPIWSKAYVGLSGFYFGLQDPSIGEAFQSALGDATIGERIGKPVDRAQQLAGSTWFYYGARYGEYLSLSKSERAEDYLPALLEEHPDRVASYEELAVWEEKGGKLVEAQAEYERALQLNDQNAITHNRLAGTLWKQGKKAEAIGEWRRAIAIVDGEIDYGMVPKGFWADFNSILTDLASHGQFGEVRNQVDGMLRTYIRRNGAYMAEPLLRSAYVASGSSSDSVRWIVELSMLENPPGALLGSLVESNWISESQKDQVHLQLIQLYRNNVASAEGSNREAAESSLRTEQIAWINLLCNRGNYPEAKKQYEAVSLDDRRNHLRDWLSVQLRLAEHDGTLASVVQSWSQSPQDAPVDEALDSAAAVLNTPSKRLVMKFRYQRALDDRKLESTNFLGLAEIKVAEGDLPGALALLHRLVAISSTPYDDLDTSSALLVKTGHDAEAAQFLTQLKTAKPWDGSYRLKLDQALLRAKLQEEEARKDLQKLAADPSSAYDLRRQAAESLAGKPVSGTLGSGELQLLASGSTSPEQARQPYYVAARITAAKAASGKVREDLLREALEISPGRENVLLDLLKAALAAHDRCLVLNIVDRVVGTPRRSENEVDSQESTDAPENYGTAPQQYTASFQQLPEQEQATIMANIADLYRQSGDSSTAILWYRQAVQLEKDLPQAKTWDAQIAGLKELRAREARNIAAAPTIHVELTQNHSVRPREVAVAAKERKLP